MINSSTKGERMSKAANVSRICYGAHEVMEATGLCDNMVYALFRSGDLPGFRVGRRWLIRPNALDTWARQKEEQTQANILGAAA